MEENLTSLIMEISKENIEYHIVENDLQNWLDRWTIKVTVALNSLLCDFYGDAIDNILDNMKKLLQEKNYDHYDKFGGFLNEK